VAANCLLYTPSPQRIIPATGTSKVNNKPRTVSHLDLPLKRGGSSFVDDKMIANWAPNSLWQLAAPLIPPAATRRQGGGWRRADDRRVLAGWSGGCTTPNCWPTCVQVRTTRSPRQQFGVVATVTGTEHCLVRCGGRTNGAYGILPGSWRSIGAGSGATASFDLRRASVSRSTRERCTGGRPGIWDRATPASPAVTVCPAVAAGDVFPWVGACQLLVSPSMAGAGLACFWLACTWMRLACTSGALGTRICSTPSWVEASIASAMTWVGRVIERRKGP
jgi:hypothetical protein